MVRALVLATLLLGAAGCGRANGGESVEPESETTAAAVISTTTTAIVSATTIDPSIERSGETTTRVRNPITLGFAGDTSFTNGLDSRDPLGEVADLLSGPDLMVVNLETAVADPGVGRPLVDKQFLFRSPPASLRLLVEAGVDVVALANNHTLDYGLDALDQTLSEIDDAGLARVGAGLTTDDAYQPLVLDVGDWKVGLVSLSRVPCDWSASGENSRPWVAWACPSLLDRAEKMVSAAVDVSDITVVMVHGGTEGVLCPSEHMVDLARRWSELGADAVLNGHPHVLQGVTSFDDTMVVHSTGNFAFPSARGLTANSAVFLLVVSEEGLQLQVEPVRVAGGVVTIPSAEQRQLIVDQINGVSSGWQLDESGRAVRSDVAGGC